MLLVKKKKICTLLTVQIGVCCSEMINIAILKICAINGIKLLVCNIKLKSRHITNILALLTRKLSFNKLYTIMMQSCKAPLQTIFYMIWIRINRHLNKKFNHAIFITYSVTLQTKCNLFWQVKGLKNSYSHLFRFTCNGTQ